MTPVQRVSDPLELFLMKKLADLVNAAVRGSFFTVVQSAAITKHHHK